MTEKQYEDALVALGCKDVTSKTQKKNGTTAFRLPDGKNMVTEHETGYVHDFDRSHSFYRPNRVPHHGCSVEVI